MNRILTPRLSTNLGLVINKLPTQLVTAFFFALGLLLLAFQVGAATNDGTALQAAFTALNDMVNGYGKQLLTLIGFAVAAIGFIASNATSVIMKFVGYAIFLGVGLAGAITLVGATV
jgi:hypothetical protein